MKKIILISVLLMIFISAWSQVRLYFHKSVRYDDEYTQKAILDMYQYRPQISYVSPSDTITVAYDADTVSFMISKYDTVSYMLLSFETKKMYFTQKCMIRDLNRFCWKRTRSALYIQIYITKHSNKMFDVCYYSGKEFICGNVWGKKKKDRPVSLR